MRYTYQYYCIRNKKGTFTYYLVKISDKPLNVNINNFFMKNRYFIKGTALYFSTLFSVLLNRRQRNSHVGFILSFLQYIVLFEVLEEKIWHHTNV